jgi:CRISPR/Cas system-associated protein Cas7 (RAMP superfamily)
MNNGKRKTREVHQLVAEAFLGHVPCGYKLVVDHIDNNKLNNRVDNLQLISQRENASKNMINKTSKYTGVYFDKSRNKYGSRIQINRENIFIGRFDCELKAHLAYQNKLKEIENGK